MRILILSWRDTKHPLSGGAESFLEELAKRLVRQGHQVTLFTSSFQGAQPIEVKAGVRIIRRGSSWTVHLEAWRWYRKQPPGTFDLTLDNFHALPFFTPLYSRQPTIGIVHEVTKELWFAETFFPINLIGYLLEPLFYIPYRRCRFLVASPSTKHDLIEFGIQEDKITVFLESIDLTPLKTLPKKNTDPLLLCLSRLSQTKRFEHAIIAMATIAQQIPKAQLLIVGSGKPEYLKKLKAKVKQYHLEEKVQFLGHIRHQHKVKLLQQAWLILGTSIREGWGLAITEAGACGTTAVTYDVPGFRDSVIQGKTGIRVKPGDPQALANATINLINNHAKRQKLAANAMQFAQGRTRNKTARQLLPILIETAGKSPQPQKLHILITSWRDIKSPASGGAEILTHEIARRLVRWGHQVTILSPIFPGARSLETINGVHFLRPSFFYATRPIAYLNWPRFLINAAATYRTQLAKQVDIIVDQVHGLPSFTPLYATKPVILFPLEVANEIWLTEIPFPGNILGWLIERLYLFLFKNFTFITISPSTASDLRRFGIRKVKIITPGIFPIPNQLPHQTKEPSFVCLGRVTRMKRVKDAIQAFTIFRHQYPKARLHITGKGTTQYLNELKSYARTLRIGRSIVFHGFVPERRKYSLLSKSWALLSTSVREGWGLNVIEAASVSTPTLAYRIPGILDTVVDGKTGLLTSINSPSALADKMILLTKNEPLRNTLGRNAKTYAQQFSWDKSARQFLQVIRDYLNNKPASDAVKQYK